jgi:hypothetical protein
MLLSMDPDAIKLPVGSNLAVKISPVCPDSSMTGACNAVVLGVCTVSAMPLFASSEICTNCLNQRAVGRIQACQCAL